MQCSGCSKLATCVGIGSLAQALGTPNCCLLRPAVNSSGNTPWTTKQNAIRTTSSFNIMHDMPRIITFTTSSVLRLLVVYHRCGVCERTKSVTIAEKSDIFKENSNTTLRTIVTSHKAAAKSNRCAKCSRKHCDKVSPHVRESERLIITSYMVFAAEAKWFLKYAF